MVGEGRGWSASSLHVFVRAELWWIQEKGWSDSLFHVYVRAELWWVKEKDGLLFYFMSMFELYSGRLKKRMVSFFVS